MKTVNYRVIATAGHNPPGQVLDELLATVRVPVSGSGLGADRTLSLGFRVADDDAARAELEPLKLTLDCPSCVSSWVLATGHGVNYRELS